MVRCFGPAAVHHEAGSPLKLSTSSFTTELTGFAANDWVIKEDDPR